MQLNDTLYSLNIGNSARGKEKVLTPVKVTKIGRKYFTVEGEGRYPRVTEHHLDTWKQKTNYSAECCLYPNAQTWEDQKEANLLFDQIRQKVGKLRPDYKLLGVFRKVAALLP